MEPSSTHDRILEAALKVFSRHGYTGATTKAIAREAGVNEVTLFRHFGNKQKLFTEMINRYSALPHIEAARADRRTPFEKRIRELAGRAMRLLEERRELIAILLSEGSRHPKQAKLILEGGPARILERLTLFFEEAQTTGEIRGLDPQCTARAFMGMMFFYVIFQKIMPGETLFPTDPKRVENTFIEILLRGLLPIRTKPKSKDSSGRRK
ncbi:MAG TPA: TetR/AcrR family transcriptional regulator [bacterium]|nr:TetR/AcrR family transcriptional regulator [Candidatus Omnitrophota bacterium]HOL95592.1 TetR/AcrR family transcriptional regulator [bacterium]HPP01697.1 TetR/AcrR family transcriptional regulator [bacterium]